MMEPTTHLTATRAITDDGAYNTLANTSTTIYKSTSIHVWTHVSSQHQSRKHRTEQTTYLIAEYASQKPSCTWGRNTREMVVVLMSSGRATWEENNQGV
jgi:hypothetical protein